MVLNSNRQVIDSISDEALVHLKTYKYSSVDKSPFSYYVLNPYWNAAVKLLPMWLAPNMVTLIGFCFILVNVALLLIYIPDLVGPGPGWVYCSFGFGLFMYQTMDNLDGKQARRTGTSSGLGELFDHGIDSLNCTLASLLEAASMGLGTSKAGVFTILCPCLPMFFSTWETYHSHTLYLGYVNGPTEVLLFAAGIMVMTGVYGPGIWAESLVNHMGGPERATELIGSSAVAFLGDYSFRDGWVATIVVSLLVGHVPFCIVHVVQARRQRNLPVMPVFLEWTPMAVYTLAIAAWVYSPYSHICSDNHIVLFSATMSFVFGRMTTKMILAHLTRQPFPYWTVMLTPLVGGAVLANVARLGFEPLSAQAELIYLWAYFFFAAAVYLRWAQLVIGSICAYLGINALTIPRSKQLENQQRLLDEEEAKAKGQKKL